MGGAGFVLHRVASVCVGDGFELVALTLGVVEACVAEDWG